jgi:hypothetical protein
VKRAEGSNAFCGIHSQGDSMFNLIHKTLPCGAILEQDNTTYHRSFVKINITNGDNFARTTKRNWCSELELIIHRDNLPLLAELIQSLIEQDVSDMK